MPDDNKPHNITGQSIESAEEKFQEKLGELALKEAEKKAQQYALVLGLGYVNLEGVPIPPDMLELVPKSDYVKHKCVVFAMQAEQRQIACADPKDKETQSFLEALQQRLHGSQKLYVMSDASAQSVGKLYEHLPEVIPPKEGVEITKDDIEKYSTGFVDIRKVQEQVKGKNTSDIITILIATALGAKSSDIHVEAEEKDIKARFRIDGVLHDVAIFDLKEWKQLVSRLKLLAGLKLNITDAPQDGRFTIHLVDDQVDVRVSTLPTKFGESIVMRLLKASSAGLKFEDLGLAEHTHKPLKEAIEKPNGMVITTGPTGSGKTTTLYAILNQLNSPKTKIITLEDPIEYKMDGVNQSQIDIEKGYTFASGLRSILRQDPDIVMVGEIRDLETADIAINAALTGHLVLSTLHTNSAIAGIPRFLAMGVKGFLLAPALSALVGQRLVRRLCDNCKKETELDTETAEKVTKILSEIPEASGVKPDTGTMKFYQPVGCEDCYGIGYKGRIGIFEVLTMNAEIEQHIHTGDVSESAIQEIAHKNGMITMVQDGLLRVLEGVTSVEEVFSVAQ